MKKKYTFNYFFATFLFSGYMPFAPGTWGTLVGLLFWLLIPISSSFIQILLIIATFIAGILVSDSIEKNQELKDPGFIVIDEVVGIWITLLFIPFEIHDILIQSVDFIKLLFPQLIMAFVLFRFFDITKIFPIKYFERLKGGLGIMADDVVAGIMSGIVLYLINMFVL